MSAIASLRVIDRSAIAAIASATDATAVQRLLNTHARDLDDDLFPWSGYCMVDLLIFLDERGIASTEPDVPKLDTSGSFVAVFGPTDRALVGRLDPQAFRPEDLIEAMKGFDFDDTEAVMAAIDGLDALRAGINALSEHELLIIEVG